MNRAAAEQALYNALQADERIRSNAEEIIKNAIQTNFQGFISVFGEVMIDTTVQQRIRQLCSIVIKNSLYSKVPKLQKLYEQNWLSCHVQLRERFKSTLEFNLNCRDHQILNNISKILGSITRIELSNNISNDLFKKVYMLLSNPEYAVGALESASVACDQLYGETEYNFDSEKEYVFRIATFYHLQAPINSQILISSLKFIQSSLEIYEEILSNDEARNCFLSKLIELKSENVEIVEKILEVICRFVDIYHRKLLDQIENICCFFNSFLETNQDFIILQVFEFWTLMAELRYDILLKKNFNIILPKLFSCLSKEDPNESEWTVHKSASSLLVLLTDDFKIGILTNSFAISFISEHLQSDDPEIRAVGAIALASICQPGCEDFIRNCMGVFVNDLVNGLIENEVLYAIARICEKDINCSLNYIPIIIEKCNAIISENSESCENSIWVIFSILSSIKQIKSVETVSAINYSFMNILSSLINRLEKTGLTEYNLRNAINTTLSELVQSCPSGMGDILCKLTEYLISKIIETLNYFSSVSKDQVFFLEDILSNHIVLLQVTLSEQKSFDYAQIASIFNSCLQTQENSSYGEVYIAISKLIDQLSSHLKNFVPFIVRDIESKQPFIIKSALNLLSDVAIELGDSFFELTPTVIPALIGTISSPNTPLDLKSTVIGVFGDIALSIGVQFKTYIEMSIVLFSQINTLQRSDDEKYVDGLRKSIMHLFSCIFLAVGDIPDMRRNLKPLIELIRQAISEDKDETYRDESVNILVDIKTLFGSKIVSDEWIKLYLLATSTGKYDGTAKKARELYETLN